MHLAKTWQNIVSKSEKLTYSDHKGHTLHGLTANFLGLSNILFRASEVGRSLCEVKPGSKTHAAKCKRCRKRFKRKIFLLVIDPDPLILQLHSSSKSIKIILASVALLLLTNSKRKRSEKTGKRGDSAPKRLLDPGREDAQDAAVDSSWKGSLGASKHGSSCQPAASPKENDAERGTGNRM